MLYTSESEPPRERERNSLSFGDGVMPPLPPRGADVAWHGSVQRPAYDARFLVLKAHMFPDVKVDHKGSLVGAYAPPLVFQLAFVHAGGKWHAFSIVDITGLVREFNKKHGTDLSAVAYATLKDNARRARVANGDLNASLIDRRKPLDEVHARVYLHYIEAGLGAPSGAAPHEIMLHEAMYEDTKNRAKVMAPDSEYGDRVKEAVTPGVFQLLASLRKYTETIIGILICTLLLLISEMTKQVEQGETWGSMLGNALDVQGIVSGLVWNAVRCMFSTMLGVGLVDMGRWAGSSVGSWVRDWLERWCPWYAWAVRSVGRPQDILRCLLRVLLPWAIPLCVGFISVGTGVTAVGLGAYVGSGLAGTAVSAVSTLSYGALIAAIQQAIDEIAGVKYMSPEWQKRCSNLEMLKRIMTSVGGLFEHTPQKTAAPEDELKREDAQSFAKQRATELLEDKNKLDELKAEAVTAKEKLAKEELAAAEAAAAVEEKYGWKQKAAEYDAILADRLASHRKISMNIAALDQADHEADHEKAVQAELERRRAAEAEAAKAAGTQGSGAEAEAAKAAEEAAAEAARAKAEEEAAKAAEEEAARAEQDAMAKKVDDARRNVKAADDALLALSARHEKDAQEAAKSIRKANRGKADADAFPRTENTYQSNTKTGVNAVTLLRSRVGEGAYANRVTQTYCSPSGICRTADVAVDKSNVEYVINVGTEFDGLPEDLSKARTLGLHMTDDQSGTEVNTIDFNRRKENGLPVPAPEPKRGWFGFGAVAERGDMFSVAKWVVKSILGLRQGMEVELSMDVLLKNVGTASGMVHVYTIVSTVLTKLGIEVPPQSTIPPYAVTWTGLCMLAALQVHLGASASYNTSALDANSNLGDQRSFSSFFRTLATLGMQHFAPAATSLLTCAIAVDVPKLSPAMHEFIVKSTNDGLLNDRLLSISRILKLNSALDTDAAAVDTALRDPLIVDVLIKLRGYEDTHVGKRPYLEEQLLKLKKGADGNAVMQYIDDPVNNFNLTSPAGYLAIYADKTLDGPKRDSVLRYAAMRMRGSPQDTTNVNSNLKDRVLDWDSAKDELLQKGMDSLRARIGRGLAAAMFAPYRTNGALFQPNSKVMIRHGGSDTEGTIVGVSDGSQLAAGMTVRFLVADVELAPGASFRGGVVSSRGDGTVSVTYTSGSDSVSVKPTYVEVTPENVGAVLGGAVYYEDRSNVLDEVGEFTRRSVLTKHPAHATIEVNSIVHYDKANRPALSPEFERRVRAGLGAKLGSLDEAALVQFMSALSAQIADPSSVENRERFVASMGAITKGSLDMKNVAGVLSSLRDVYEREKRVNFAAGIKVFTPEELVAISEVREKKRIAELDARGAGTALDVGARKRRDRMVFLKTAKGLEAESAATSLAADRALAEALHAQRTAPAPPDIRLYERALDPTVDMKAVFKEGVESAALGGAFMDLSALDAQILTKLNTTSNPEMLKGQDGEISGRRYVGSDGYFVDINNDGSVTLKRTYFDNVATEADRVKHAATKTKGFFWHGGGASAMPVEMSPAAKMALLVAVGATDAQNTGRDAMRAKVAAYKSDLESTSAPPQAPTRTLRGDFIAGTGSVGGLDANHVRKAADVLSYLTAKGEPTMEERPLANNETRGHVGGFIVPAADRSGNRIPNPTYQVHTSADRGVRVQERIGAHYRDIPLSDDVKSALVAALGAGGADRIHTGSDALKRRTETFHANAHASKAAGDASRSRDAASKAQTDDDIASREVAGARVTFRDAESRVRGVGSVLSASVGNAVSAPIEQVRGTVEKARGTVERLVTGASDAVSGVLNTVRTNATGEAFEQARFLEASALSTLARESRLEFNRVGGPRHTVIDDINRKAARAGVSVPFWNRLTPVVTGAREAVGLSDSARAVRPHTVEVRAQTALPDDAVFTGVKRVLVIGPWNGRDAKAGGLWVPSSYKKMQVVVVSNDPPSHSFLANLKPSLLARGVPAPFDGIVVTAPVGDSGAWSRVLPSLMTEYAVALVAYDAHCQKAPVDGALLHVGSFAVGEGKHPPVFCVMTRVIGPWGDKALCTTPSTRNERDHVFLSSSRKFVAASTIESAVEKLILESRGTV